MHGQYMREREGIDWDRIWQCIEKGDLKGCTVEPRFNEPLFNEVLDITNDTLCPAKITVKCME